MTKSKSESSSNSKTDTLRSATQVSEQFKNALPTILSAINEYQPQFSQAAYQDYATMLPQYAQTQYDLSQQYAPNQYALGEELSAQALQRSKQGLTDQERQMYLDQYKALVGNQVSSGIGANTISNNLLGQDLAAKQWGQQLGSGLVMQPITAGSVGYSPSTFSVGSAFSPVFSDQVYGQTSNSNSTTTKTPSTFSTVMQGLGAAAGLMSGVGALGGLGGGGGSLSSQLSSWNKITGKGSSVFG